MKSELHNGLCEYLGELKAEKDQTFEWIEKDNLIERINAVNLLLGLDEKELTFLEKIKNIHDERKIIKNVSSFVNGWYRFKISCHAVWLGFCN
jgi:hypothetical protein